MADFDAFLRRVMEPLARAASEGDIPAMDPELAVLKHRADQADTRMERIEGKIDRIDDRLRGVEVRLGEVMGKLDLLAAKIPSWWQPPVGAAVLIAALVAALTLVQRLGLVHLMDATKP